MNAHGLPGGVVPVTAHVPLNPSLVSAGVKYHFGRGAMTICSDDLSQKYANEDVQE